MTPFAMPVIVFIHGGLGGEFQEGSSSDFGTGKFFMDQDVVLVTINYRLGPFGKHQKPLLSLISDFKNFTWNFRFSEYWGWLCLRKYGTKGPSFSLRMGPPKYYSIRWRPKSSYHFWRRCRRDFYSLHDDVSNCTR